MVAYRKVSTYGCVYSILIRVYNCPPMAAYIELSTSYCVDRTFIYLFIVGYKEGSPISGYIGFLPIAGYI